MIITGIMLLALFALQFIAAKPSDVGSTEFWINLVINAAIIVAMALTWTASGNDRAKEENDSPYKRNCLEYGRRIAEIETRGELSSLTEFCAAKTKELRDAKENRYLVEACIDRDKYNEVKGYTLKRLKSEGYNRKQRRRIIRVTKGKIRVKAISAMEMMTNNTSKLGYDVHYNETAEKAFNIGVRAVKSVITGAALAYISAELTNSITDPAAWAMFAVKLVTIAYAAWSSEREGYEQIAGTKNRVILRRIKFLNLFTEWSTPPPKQ